MGKNRGRQGHELVQAAEAAIQVVAGTQIKMIGVGEDNFPPSSSSASCVCALTVACVPTGRKNGVCTTPCGVVRRPQRGPVESVFRASKEKGTRSVYQEKMKTTPTRMST